MEQTGKCSICGQPSRKNQRYCRECHNSYMRKWRKTHKPTSLQRKKSNARAYARVYMLRGKLQKGHSCEDCGWPQVEMHHEDYDKPLEVTWLCRACHEIRHNKLIN